MKRQQYSTALEANSRADGAETERIARLLNSVQSVVVTIMLSFGNASMEMKAMGRASMINRESLVRQLSEYLQHRITRSQLVNWAEQAMMEGDFDERNFETIRDITARIGLADVREFGLTWENCESFLSRLGYRANVDIVQS